VSTASRGRTLEHRARHELEAAGWWVIRSAGSKGAADLVAFNGGRIGFVQCKLSPGPLPKGERAAMWRLQWESGAPGAELVHYLRSSRGVYEWRQLTGPGPNDYREWHPQGDHT